MEINQYKENLKIVFQNKKNFFYLFLLFFIFFSLFFLLSDYEIVKGNYGETHFQILIITQFLISLLFSFFIILSINKYLYFKGPSSIENTTSIIGIFFGSLVTGCTSCSITLASFIGLAGFISALPQGGLELNYLSIILLSYSNYSLLKNFSVCKLKKH